MKSHTSQCDSCAFKIPESQANLEDNRAVEKKYQVLRDLENAPKKLRVVSVSLGVERTSDTDKTETCFIDSPLWPSKARKIHCPHKIDDCLSLEDALSFRHSSAANKLAEDANSTASKALEIARDEALSARTEARSAKLAAIIATTALIMSNMEQIMSIINPSLLKVVQWVTTKI